ncbi:MAG: nicotinate-nucleotide diphosphorylase (carboxylating), partial [Thermotogae bacterium]|nr:nicotinate-nucleotide diphosphorylase (carboxylating) [Thermotogota bacterium]
IALEAGVDIIMLDNFKAEDAKKTAAKLKDEKEDIVVEVSGGIGETNFMDYLSKDIDVISMGSLTTEIEYRDFSMEII